MVLVISAKSITIRIMKYYARWMYILLVIGLLQAACQPNNLPMITVLEDGNIHPVQTDERVPLFIINAENIPFAAGDRLYLNGQPVQVDEPLPSTQNLTLQVRHAVPVKLVTPHGEQDIQSVALTVGEALRKSDIQLYASDFIDPPLNTPLSDGMSIFYRPAREVTVMVGGKPVQIRTSAQTVGAALAGAGIPLQNVDYSLPDESETIPDDGQIRVIRVTESIQLIQKSIPFESESITSAEVELDQQQILQPGQPGLSVSRVRIRYENGQEVSRLAESETIVRPPEDRVVGFGTKVVTRTTTVGGTQIEYWRAVQMYATSYSPCRSGADRCYPGTSSGKPVKKGVVAMTYANYLAMQGQPLYIPGYGYATVEDVGGGIPGQLWIDLGYSDDDWQQWGSWVTVYFLTPVPASFPYILDY
jgi:uncharacterized protein YabE (DUF348 family)